MGMACVPPDCIPLWNSSKECIHQSPVHWGLQSSQEVFKADIAFDVVLIPECVGFLLGQLGWVGGVKTNVKIKIGSSLKEMLNSITESIDSPDPFSPKLGRKLYPTSIPSPSRSCYSFVFKSSRVLSVCWFTLLSSQSNLWPLAKRFT